MAVPFNPPATFPTITQSTTDGTNFIRVADLHVFFEAGTNKAVAKCGFWIDLGPISKHREVEFSATDVASAVLGLLTLVTSYF